MMYNSTRFVVLRFTSTCRQVQQTCPLPLICTRPSQPSSASYRSGSTALASRVVSWQKYGQIHLSRRTLRLFVSLHEQRSRRGTIATLLLFGVSYPLEPLGTTVFHSFMLSSRASSLEMSGLVGQCQLPELC